MLEKLSAIPLTRDPPLYEQAQTWLRPSLTEGSVAIDATCGNGHDTLYLCREVGPEGTVYAMDLQEDAIRSTQSRLEGSGYQAILNCLSHLDFEKFFVDQPVSSIDAAIFNLGYLPGGDHTIITKPASTVEALRAILKRATPRFRLSIVAYRGHPGGTEETEAVLSFLSTLSPSSYQYSLRSGKNATSGPLLISLTTTPFQIQ